MKEPYIEAQAKFLNGYKKYDNFFMGQNEDVTFWTVDGFVLHVVPNKLFFLNMDAVLGSREKTSDAILKQLSDEKYSRAKITKYLPNSAWKEIAVISNDFCSVWIQKKHLKEFPSDVEFEIIGETNAVKILYNENVCGCIMPMRKQ